MNKPTTEEIKTLKRLLKSFYHHEGIERVGFVLASNKIREVRNVSPEPEYGFLVDPKDTIEALKDSAWATWHTHPNQDSNLSGEDYRNFMNWPDLVHFIVGSDSVKGYYYDSSKKSILELD